jgi:hypothetical protein
MVEHIVCNTKRWCLDPEVRRRASSGGFAPQRALSHFWEMEAQGISCFFLKKQKLRRLTKFFAISWKLRLCTWMKAQLFFVLWKKAPYLNESLAIFRRTKVSYSDENSAIFVFSLGNEFFYMNEMLSFWKIPFLGGIRPLMGRLNPKCWHLAVFHFLLEWSLCFHAKVRLSHFWGATFLIGGLWVLSPLCLGVPLFSSEVFEFWAPHV